MLRVLVVVHSVQHSQSHAKLVKQELHWHRGLRTHIISVEPKRLEDSHEFFVYRFLCDLDGNYRSISQLNCEVLLVQIYKVHDRDILAYFESLESLLLLEIVNHDRPLLISKQYLYLAYKFHRHYRFLESELCMHNHLPFVISQNSDYIAQV